MSGRTESRQVDHARWRYSWLARVYDHLPSLWLEAARLHAVELLELKAGETVLDLGCGTGRGFGPIEDRIGPGGRLLGVDASEAMLARARARVAARRWTNVTLIQSDAARLALAARVDAVLCFCTHDILTSPEAVAGAVGLLRPRGRIVAAGNRQPPGRLAKLLNLPCMLSGRLCAVRLGDRIRPWRELEARLPSTRLVTQWRGGAFYFVRGER